MKRKHWIWFAAGLLLLATVLLVMHISKPASDDDEAGTSQPQTARVTVVEPTCIAAGYSLVEDLTNGSIRVEEGMPALGHAPDGMGLCARCGEKVAAASLPRLELNGSMEGISKDQRIKLAMTFTDDQQQVNGWAYTTWQGHESMAYEKKNYTIRLFEDEALTKKLRLTFGHWQPEHKYILKACYRDPSMARNLLAARLWGEMARTRTELPAQLAATANMGAVDGFPVSVWLNGEFHGLYTFNLHKDDDLFRMNGVGREAIMISNAQTMEESLFRAPAAFVEDVSDWEVEYCGTEDQTWAKDSLNALITFVMDSDDAAFRRELPQHLDVEAAMDYLIALWAMGLTDAGAVDLVLVKYEDTPWIPSLYDMEDAFGLTPDGLALAAEDAALPVMEQGKWRSGTGSLLWDRLLQCYTEEIIARYRALRENVLDSERMIGLLDAYIAQIPPEDMAADLALYPDRGGPQMDHDKQIADYIYRRLEILDTLLKEEMQ